MFTALTILGLTLDLILCQSNFPVGHGDVLGKHRPSDGHIDTFTTFPSPQEFWTQYASQRRPALFKGAALHFPAFTLWTDSYLIEHFGSLEVKLEHKYEKKDAPVGERGLGRDTIKSFLDDYQKSNAYIVSQLPDPMSKNVSILPFLTCGSFYERLLEANLWLSSGGSKSLLHRDADNAFNCLLNGTKDWILIDPKYEDKIPIAEGDRGYGGFATLDVDKVNLLKYKSFKDVHWQYANVSAGDCLFLPYGYWHQVRSYGSKNVAVSVLFSRLQTFDDTGCDKPLEYMSLNDTGMVWTYPGHGKQTLGNPDPFELKDSCMEILKNGKNISVRRLAEFYPEFDDEENQWRSRDSKKRALAYGKEIFNALDINKDGHIDMEEVLTSPIQLWKKMAERMDEDPANGDDFEFYSISPDDVKAVVKEAMNDKTHTLAEADWIRLYTTKLQGSERWAKILFRNLKGNWEGETIPQDIVNENLDEQLELYKRKGRDDDSGEFYRRELDDDIRIMQEAQRQSTGSLSPAGDTEGESANEYLGHKHPEL